MTFVPFSPLHSSAVHKNDLLGTRENFLNKIRQFGSQFSFQMETPRIFLISRQIGKCIVRTHQDPYIHRYSEEKKPADICYQQLFLRLNIVSQMKSITNALFFSNVITVKTVFSKRQEKLLSRAELNM